MKSILISMIALCSASGITAKEYLGIDLCGNATADTIRKAIEKKGATVSSVKSEEFTISVESKDFKVADSERELSVYIYKGKVESISVKPATGLIEILNGKYGEPIRNEFKDYGVMKTNDNFYSTKDDRNLILSWKEISFFSSVTGGSSSIYVRYQCRPVAAQKSADDDRQRKLDAIEKSKKEGL